MSIVLTRLELPPKDCTYCIEISGDGTWEVLEENIYHGKAIQIPEGHGPLADVEALAKKLYKEQPLSASSREVDYWIRKIRTADPLVPAWEPEEEEYDQNKRDLAIKKADAVLPNSISIELKERWLNTLEQQIATTLGEPVELLTIELASNYLLMRISLEQGDLPTYNSYAGIFNKLYAGFAPDQPKGGGKK